MSAMYRWVKGPSSPQRKVISVTVMDPSTPLIVWVFLPIWRQPADVQLARRSNAMIRMQGKARELIIAGNSLAVVKIVFQKK
jgi:hypothetical protein